MENFKSLFIKHGLVILAVISILVLALPFYTITGEASVDMGDLGLDIDVPSAESKTTVDGFKALNTSIFAYVLIIGPALLIAMNYISQLGKYKGILAIAVPAACIVSMIIIFLTAKSSYIKASGGMMEMEVKLGLGIGAVLAFISYIASIICGAMTYHNFTLDKSGLEKIKNAGLNFVENAQAAIKNGAQSIAPNGENAEKASAAAPASNATPASETAPAQNVHSIPFTQKAQKRNGSNVEEILSLIERLSKMKEDGILTEEEFSDKKKKLLEEI